MLDRELLHVASHAAREHIGVVIRGLARALVPLDVSALAPAVARGVRAQRLRVGEDVVHVEARAVDLVFPGIELR